MSQRFSLHDNKNINEIKRMLFNRGLFVFFYF